MADDATAAEKEARELVAAATAGPWVSMRDGNQYVGSRLVGASRISQIPRPSNPYSYTRDPNASRFLDADADFIAWCRTGVPALLATIDELRAQIAISDRLSEAGVKCSEEVERRLHAEIDELRAELAATTVDPYRHAVRDDAVAERDAAIAERVRLRDSRDWLRVVLGHIETWTHEHGKALCPPGADTYGDGMRDAKAQVGRMLAALTETEKP